LPQNELRVEDLQGEIDQILGKLKDLSKEAEKDPRKVQDKVSKLRGRLEQIKNILMGKAENKSEKLVEDHSI
jgi:uncharacterized protein YfcZ (UPF0381/DUF406 family)